MLAKRRALEFLFLIAEDEEALRAAEETRNKVGCGFVSYRYLIVDSDIPPGRNFRDDGSGGGA